MFSPFEIKKLCEFVSYLPVYVSQIYSQKLENLKNLFFFVLFALHKSSKCCFYVVLFISSNMHIRTYTGVQYHTTNTQHTDNYKNKEKYIRKM